MPFANGDREMLMGQKGGVSALGNCTIGHGDFNWSLARNFVGDGRMRCKEMVCGTGVGVGIGM